MKIASILLSFCLAFNPYVYAGRTFASASSQYLEASSSPITDVPCTISAWVIPQGLGTGQAIVAVGASAGQTRLQISTTGTGNFGAAAVNSGGTAGTSSNVSSLVNGTKYHIAGVFTSTTSRVVYVNGSAATANTTSVTATGMDTVRVGARYGASLGAYWDGDVEEVGIWNVALTAAEITSLSKGVSPKKIRPQSLVFYAPLYGNDSPENDMVQGRTLTLNGSPTKGDHMRVYN